MCYRTTYLFSLCGHISVSSEPIKDTQPCRSINKPQDNETTPAHAPLRSSTDLLSAYPSPQEFEFAKVLHDSLPASPVSPLRSKQDVGNIINTYTSKHETFTSPVKAQSASMSMKMSNVNVQCPIIKRHPLHTFLIPNLCLVCGRVRDRNIARFEAQAIKDNVEMALTAGSRNGKGLQSSVITDERRKISPPKGKKGTIPLILSAMHSQKGGDPVFERSNVNAEGRSPAEVMMDAAGDRGVHSESGSTDAIVAIASTPETMQARAQAQMGGDKVSDSQDAHSRNTSTLLAATASSWWRWRKPSTLATATANSLSTTLASTTESLPLSATSSCRKSSVKTGKHRRSSSALSSPTSQSGPSRLSWRGKYDQDVQRDVLGRSTKGMDRIMGRSASEGDNAK